MVIQIKQDILDQVRKDDDLLYAISKAGNVKFRTALAWVMQNHIMLTTEAIQDIIRKGLGLSEDEKITEKKALENAA